MCREKCKDLKKKVFFVILAVCIFFLLLSRTEGLTFGKAVKFAVESLMLVPLWRENFKLLSSLKKKGGEILGKIVVEKTVFFL